MSMRLLFRYAGGLACLVTALALVGCGGGPGSQPEPNQIENQAFRQGEQIRTIPLSDKFSGSDLTYSATTSNARVATVAVDNATLTLTAVGPGTATITVTAENSQGEAEQTFTVTVPQPPTPTPDPTPDPVEIPDIPSLARDTAETIPLGDKFSGENLTYTASSSNERVAIVSVNQAILTVRAVGPGTATITVTATAQGSADQTQTFTVTVPQPVEAPTVRTGATASVSVAQGSTQTVTLSQVFTGTGHSFTVRSSDTAVATVSESGGTLTITGVSVGSATITVTATNTAGSSPAHAIAVTVTAPVTTTPTPPTSSTLTIELGESAKRTLAAGQTLQVPAGDGVTVEPSPDGETGNVWLITAKKKGIHKITVLSAGKAVGTITVEVPNSRPVRTDTPHPATPFPLTNPADVVILTGTGTYFTDADEGDTVSERFYRIEDKPSWFLIETKDGFVLDNDGTTDDLDVKYEVLQKVEPSNEKNYEFTVSLYASDGEEESTRPVVMRFSVNDDTGLALAVNRNYNIDQEDGGNFRDSNKDGSYNNRLDVGPRREVTTTVTFLGTVPAESLSQSGFVFVENAHEDIPSADRPTNETPSIFYRDGRNAVKLAEDGSAADIPTSYQVPGTRYYLIRGTGAVVVEGGAADRITIGANAKVSFSLKGGSSGSIIIEYKVWLNKNLRDHDNDGGTTPERTTTTKTATKTLTINVLNCSSPPNPISDCP